MNKRPKFRRAQSRVTLIKDKYINVKRIGSFILLIAILFLLIPFILYFSVYYGYKAKIIEDIDQIPEEIDSALLIAHSTSPESLSLLFKISEEMLENRKVNNLYIYTLGDPENLQIENLVNQSKFWSESQVNINSADNIYEVCVSTKELYSLSKLIILSNEDYAIRASFQCNFQDIYSIPFTNEAIRDISNRKDGFFVILTEIFKTTFNLY